jgi:putative peptidoglycan lipid II flippase
VTSSQINANRQIARAAGTVMVAFILSQIVGLVRRILVVDAFPAIQLDAFIAANRVSETLFSLVAGGALGSAFIPTFTGMLARKDRDGSWKLASSITNLVFLVSSLLALGGIIFAPQIVRNIIAPGFATDPLKVTLAVELMRIQLFSAVLFSLSGLVMGMLNSHQIFLIPALAPSMYQLGMIFGILVLSKSMGIYGLAWGVVIGAGLHLFIQLPALFKLRGEYSFTLGLNNPIVRQVGRLMGPRLLGVAVVQLNFWVNIWLASHMVNGSVLAIEYGFALMLMAQAAIAQSIATAALPTFSTQYALNKLNEMQFSLAKTLRGVIFLSMPAAAGLILLREPLITLLFQRGSFDSNSTQLVAWALLWYAAGLVSHSVMEITARAFYALHDTKTPVLIGITAMSLNILFSILFSTAFLRAGWMPHGGLALANSLATTLEVFGLLAIMRRKLGGLETSSIWSGLLQAGIATIGMSVGILFWLNQSTGYAFWLINLVGIFTGVVLFGGMLFLLRVPEIKLIFNFIRRRQKPLSIQ